MRFLILGFIQILGISSLFAAQNVPDPIKISYANNFYSAFQMQCYGKSTSAAARFWSAYDEAKAAGESAQKLLLMEQLFIWYRTYGTSCHLFEQAPSGWDVIVGEYKNPYQGSDVYQSEWGKTPEQAALIREFMFGFAEVISSIFCVTIGSVAAVNIGRGMAADGLYRLWSAGSGLWTMHQRALIDLKKCEETAKKISKQ